MPHLLPIGPVDHPQDLQSGLSTTWQRVWCTFRLVPVPQPNPRVLGISRRARLQPLFNCHVLHVCGCLLAVDTLHLHPRPFLESPHLHGVTEFVLPELLRQDLCSVHPCADRDFTSVRSGMVYRLLQSNSRGMQHIWNHAPGESHHSHKGDGFRKFVYVLTIILMVVKVLSLSCR